MRELFSCLDKVKKSVLVFGDEARGQRGQVVRAIQRPWVWVLPLLLAGFVRGSSKFRSSITLVNTGFVQGLEFLKKAGKMVKSLEFFFQSYNNCFISEFLALWSNLIQSRRVFAVHREKSFVPAFFKICIDHLFDNFESGKRNYCFGKISTKPLNSQQVCLRSWLGFLTPLG